MKNKSPKIKNHYYLLVSILLCLISSVSLAQQLKVTERSGKRPAWVNGLSKNYLTATGSGDSIQQAEEQAIEVLQNQLLSIVYEEVKANHHVEDSPYLSEKINYFLENEFSSPYQKEKKTAFFKTIDIQYATDTYWEKMLNKKTKETFYYYHLRYPFTQRILDTLAHDFMVAEKDINGRLNYFKSRRNRLTNVETIDSTLTELNTFFAYYNTDEQEEATSLISNYQSLYNSVGLVEENSEPGIFRYSINLQGRMVTSSQIPTVSSNCATILKTGVYEKDASIMEVRYSTKVCAEAPDNYIEIRYNFGKNTINKRFHIISDTPLKSPKK